MQAIKKRIRINRLKPFRRVEKRSPARGLIFGSSKMVSPEKAPPIETVSDFLNRAKPPMEMALDPILTRGGSAMVWGPTGIGKSRYGLGISFAIASGGSFLRYTAPEPLKVLHIAAEMTEQEFEKMVKETIAAGYALTENLSFTHHKMLFTKVAAEFRGSKFVIGGMNIVRVSM